MVFVGMSENVIETVYTNLKKMDQGVHHNKQLQELYNRNDLVVLLNSSFPSSTTDFTLNQIAATELKAYKLNGYKIYNIKPMYLYEPRMDFLTTKLDIGFAILVYLIPENSYDRRKRIPVGVFSNIDLANKFIRDNYTGSVYNQTLVKSDNRLTKKYFDWIETNTKSVYIPAKRLKMQYNPRKKKA